LGTFVFRLPDVGEGVTEAEIAAWYVKVGDHVEEDQPLLDVLTDKATVDMTSPVRGVVTAIHGEVGESRAVKSPLVELEVEGHVSAEAEPEPAAAPEPALAKGEVAPEAKPEPKAKAAKPTSNSGQVLAAPAVRARAASLGIDLAGLRGSGEGGRITHADLDTRLGSAAPATAAPSGPHPASSYADRAGVSAIKVIGMRRKIAEQMALSKRSIPHFAYVEEVDVTNLEALRARYNAKAEQRLSILPFFALAVVRTIPDFPQVNSVFDDQAGVLYQSGPIHLGVATQTPNGLMVPVVRDAQSLGVKALSDAIAKAAAAARDGSAKREELSGSTFTISSLGTLGGVAAMPVINFPEVAILAPNKLRDHLVLKDGQVEQRKVMNLSGSFDHRIVDGHDAASFVSRIKALLEEPELMLLG
jgi:2-oxoisovalerate dehydrogenase E2 component (dihydrolipoyl transacylase)